MPGFRASFTAYTAQGAGVIVMTNSNNGSQLAQELILTIGREYGWDGLMPQEKTVVTLDLSEYESLVGLYRVQDPLVNLEVTYQEGQLFVGQPGREPLALLPEADLTFFGRQGYSVEFLSSDGVITALIAGGTTRADRVHSQ